MIASRKRCWVILLFALLQASCDVFTPRTPEDPETGAGTFSQPDTPEQVVENLQAAIRELNTPNYRRSLAADLMYSPTAVSEARDPGIWVGWGQAEEERYFSSLVAAGQTNADFDLRLNDVSISVIDEQTFVFDATYVLIVNHGRINVAEEVQGRLIWEIVQGEDGLWSLQNWTDREITGAPSWSDLKAEFIK